ncbi:hypothetical protein LWF01_00740 [Saxibacter everestensis]|uniref:Class I SAM-dependent methyltransferase n=1 Tax=Saxibacter everestensis TaxID=2909229 RepID=A0ABY8QTR2_9MICO|nr:hypothetical protein LWF01_00740 [Brevibacteriaceae bacterium ZFBP1038]
MNTWAPRVLHFALPIQSGERVAVFGKVSPVLLTSLKDGEVDIVTAEFDDDPDAAGRVDHAIVPGMPEESPAELCRRLARWVRPGGTVLLAAHNARHFSRRGRGGLTRTQGEQVLAEQGFSGIEVYGIRNKLRVPRHLVPLDHPGALGWYFTSAYLPNSIQSVVMIRLLARLRPSWLGPILFPALAFVARRGPGTEGESC